MRSVVRRVRTTAVGLVIGLIVTLLPTGLSPAAAELEAQQLLPQRDIMLVLDGSGSIGAEDWERQLDGFVGALADRTLVPRDGTVAIGVVQFAGTDTRLELPLTTITTSTIGGVLTAVRDIDQQSGSTNSGDGIAAAADHLDAAGRTNASWTLCISVDGTRNSGISLEDARDHAQLQGVEQLDVLAFEDLGEGFSRDQAYAEYGPVVFDDAQVLFSRPRLSSSSTPRDASHRH